MMFMYTHAHLQISCRVQCSFCSILRKDVAGGWGLVTSMFAVLFKWKGCLWVRPALKALWRPTDTSLKPWEYTPMIQKCKNSCAACSVPGNTALCDRYYITSVCYAKLVYCGNISYNRQFLRCYLTCFWCKIPGINFNTILGQCMPPFMIHISLHRLTIWWIHPMTSSKIASDVAFMKIKVSNH